METKTHTPSTESVSARPTVRPAVDIYENQNELMLVVDLPGVSRDQVFIDLDKDTLTIVGKRQEHPPEGARVLAGQPYGWDFKRQFSVSEDIDQTGIKASLDNGVLEVVLPRHERTKPRRITIGH